MSTINKINVGGTEYEVGGSKAKLVASIEEASGVQFEINTVLKPGKIYLFKLMIGYVYRSILYGAVDKDGFFYSSSVLTNDQNDSPITISKISIENNETHSTIVFYDQNTSSILFDPDEQGVVHLYVYELPFTLGGVE